MIQAVISLLVVAILFFVTFPIFKRMFIKNHFVKSSSKKMQSFSKKLNVPFLQDVELETTEGSTVKANQILFGNKFIYFINDYSTYCTILGNIKDNSWLEINRFKKTVQYIDNLLKKNSIETERFCKIAKLDKSLLVPIVIINKECDLRVNEKVLNNSHILTIRKAKKLISQFEKEEVIPINKQALDIVIEIIKKANEETKKHKINK